MKVFLLFDKAFLYFFGCFFGTLNKNFIACFLVCLSQLFDFFIHLGKVLILFSLSLVHFILGILCFISLFSSIRAHDVSRIHYSFFCYECPRTLELTLITVWLNLPMCSSCSFWRVSNVFCISSWNLYATYGFLKFPTSNF